MNLRTLSSKLHLYFGLIAGLLLAPIGLSGSILVFHDAIDEAFNPDLLTVAPQHTRVSLQSVVDSVQQVFPHETVVQLEIPQEKTGVHEVALTDYSRTVYVDPYRGDVLGSRSHGEGITGMLFDLHVELLGGATGKTVVGILGFVLIAISLTGLVLWWRGPHQVLEGLKIKRTGSAQRLNYDLHNVLGFGSSLLLIVLAFTGSALIFYNTFHKTAHVATNTPLPPPPPSSTVQLDVERPSLDQMASRTRQAMPNATIRRIYFPTAPEEAFLFRIKQPAEPHQNGMTMVYIDQYSGQILRVDDALKASFAATLGQWLYPLHTGVFGGWWGRLLVALLGLMPTFFLVTGFLIWRWPKNKRRRARPKARAVPVEFPSPPQT